MVSQTVIDLRLGSRFKALYMYCAIFSEVGLTLKIGEMI